MPGFPVEGHIYIYIYTYTYYMSQSVIRQKYFMSRFICYYQPESQRVKIKPESEISCHITLKEFNKWFVLH